MHPHNSGLESESALTASNLDDMGILQEELVFFIMELNTHLAQYSETLEKDTGEVEQDTGT